MRWWFAPGSDGVPVINLRSERRRFRKNRCLVPAQELDLFTGDTSPKVRWRARLERSGFVLRDCEPSRKVFGTMPNNGRRVQIAPADLS
jgi:hypothetical protein